MTKKSNLVTGDGRAPSGIKLSNLDLAGFCLVFVLLLVSGLVGYFNVTHLAATNQIVTHTYEVIGALESTLSTLKDAETGQRGFLITEEELYLEPFNAALKKISLDTSRVRQLTVDNPVQQLKVGKMELTIDKRLEELKRTVAVAKNGDRASAVSFVKSGVGKATMDSLRKEVSDMQAVELDLLDIRNRQATSRLNSTIWCNIVTTAFGLSLSGVVMLLSQKNIRQRQRSFEAVSEQKEQLRTTLASIGDGVITTNHEGLVTNLNPIAEGLTGWTNTDAAGVPLITVFNIVNETTRQTVSNPAMRALEEGIIVGLANHTILIAKDGSERFIDDSAAPIRSVKGKITGCVLVFRDISERKLLENQVSERLLQTRLLASIVESSSDAIISKTLDGTIQSWNNGAKQLFGFDAEHSIGKHITMLIPPDRLADEKEFMDRLREGKSVKDFETVRRRSDGQFVDVSINLSPILNDEGQVIAASKIARDITERKKTEEKLRQLAAELSESSRRKDEFLATLAHELRNPLAPIRNGLHIIQLAKGDEETIEQTRSMIERQVTQLVRLVDDLLDVSRISRGKLEMRKQPIDLKEAIKIAVETCQPVIAEFGHELIVHASAAPMMVDADMIRMAQVFANLLNNAAKYSERGGRIILSAEHRGNDVVVCVKDTGIGIPTYMLGKVFEMFTQVDRSLERSQGGLGIGLTLVKRLVELHNGKIDVKSDGPGTGSEFTIHLPLLTTPVAASASKASCDSKEATTRCKILVADDNTDSARTLAIILTFMGHEVQTANDGQEALYLAESFRPDVILLDIGMPRLNGFEACRKIREKPWGNSLIIIALTGWGQAEDKRLSQEAGFSYHLVKPVDTTLLKQILVSELTNSQKK